MSLQTVHNNKGLILIAVYALIAVLMIIGGAFFMRSYSESKLAERHEITVKAKALAEAGIEQALYDLRRDFVNDPTPSWADGDINGTAWGPDFNNFLLFLAPTALGDEGTYMVELKNVTGYTDHIYIRSTGTIDQVSITILVYTQMNAISIWDNAVFAGAGSAGEAAINGNVDIRGSVHILGEGLNPGDMAMDMSGGAKIGNNYEGIPSELSSRVPSLETEVFNGEEVETLYAKLRVKNGLVGLSGSATVGEANLPGNSYKETVEAVYVTDGYGGNQGSDNVYSDNGYSNPYDLGDTIAFPSLYDAYGVYATYLAYLRDNALVISDPADLNDFSNIRPDSVFDYSGSNGSISMDGNGNLYIDGIVFLDGGNLEMEKQGPNKTINYTGTGSIVVVGEVEIEVNLLTVGNESFPNNILGIMTTTEIEFDEANIDIMGLFYAENEIKVEKQTNIAGTIVSNYFDMGSQVPSIFQVPETINNLPPGMIGGQPIWQIEIVAWQE